MRFPKPLLLALVVLVATVAACSGSGPKHSDETNVSIEPGDVTVETVAAPVELPDADQEQILAAVRAYVEDGIVKTLRGGAPRGMGAIFDALALAQLKGADANVMFDTGAPKANGDVTAETKPIKLTALADGFGTIILVTARINLTVKADTEDGELTVQRVGNFTFAPDAGGDAWLITSFDMKVRRTGAGVTDAPAEISTTTVPEETTP